MMSLSQPGSPLILGLLTTVAMTLFVVMLLTVLIHHRSRRRARVPVGSLVRELIWSVIPWLILVGAVTPAVVGIMHDSQTPPVQARVFEPGEN
jgi:heme/copper-type cytochrome/quinol oxidase subunit 2